MARLARDKTAYDVISARLQARQDVALAAGIREFAEELSRIGSGLFSAYLKLAPVLREAGARIVRRLM